MADALGGLELAEPFVVYCDPNKGVTTTHDDEGWMARVLTREWAARPIRGFTPMRSAERFVRRPSSRCSQSQRGPTRRHRPRVNRRNARRARSPGRLGDDEPSPADRVVAPLGGVA
jgi:hypothetical protein